LHHNKISRQLPLWVIRVVLAIGQPLPVYPDQRTSSEPAGTSVLCHNRTHSIQQTTCYSITPSAPLAELQWRVRNLHTRSTPPQAHGDDLS
jgi:hypothetical protein